MLGRWPIKLRGARKRGEEEGILKQLWDNYRKEGVKRKIRKEKKELRKRTVRKIREQVARVANSFGLM